jgi:hypothetical protein
METAYTYLFIRRDLPGPTQIVQAAHAAAEAGHKFGEHSHLICFGIHDQNDLLKASIFLESKGIRFQMFFEPDHNTGYTAICTEPLKGDARKPMRRFSLLQPDSCVA